ncbi:ABC transporter ATP-binding protein [Bosea sp. 685]|uniref:ABC transporter ATP-binding protein n=1 Tax=Bosea sp. 685 TaxID=3080057 RepID=UPI0028933285|nr:ABC transporter ATP-binding protein [Bosea sp. 685]WNJ88096.1 ABC transporter ATP-binding protein [Bosea sp. 685]
MNDTIVAISDVSKRYSGAAQPALAGVSLDIRRNEFFTLLGPSGCGKTTLLRLIAGFGMPDSGQISLDGKLLGQTPPNLRPINTVFQSYALFPHMSVAENVGFGLEMLGRPRETVRSRVAEMLRLVRLEGMGERRPAQLSGGQQQRVALARALAPAPKVLLLDEPLSALDLKLRREMQIELKRLQTETGITFVFVTHDQEEALAMSDRLAVMRDGVVMQVGSPENLYDRPANLFVAEFIGEANFWNATCLERSGAGGRFAIGTSEAVMHVAEAQGLTEGAKAVLVVRPERITLGAAEPGLLHGTVETAVYRGSDLVVHAALAGGGELRARLPGSIAAAGLIGTATGFAFPADAVRVFPA